MANDIYDGIFMSSIYMENDCACGYAKHNTESCLQKECSRFVSREQKCCQRIFDNMVNTASEYYKARMKSATKK